MGKKVKNAKVEPPQTCYIADKTVVWCHEQALPEPWHGTHTPCASCGIAWPHADSRCTSPLDNTACHHYHILSSLPSLSSSSSPAQAPRTLFAFHHNPLHPSSTCHPSPPPSAPTPPWKNSCKWGDVKGIT